MMPNSNRAEPALSFPAWLSLCVLAFSTLGVMHAHAASHEVGAPAEHEVTAVSASRYCYNWDFLNNTGQDANDLHLALVGVTQPDSWYTGSLNPFGTPDASSHYDPAAGAYRANFSGAVVLPGELVHIGLCAGRPALEVGTAAWTVDGSPVAPAPLTARVRFTHASPALVTVEVANPGSSPLLLLALNVLDGGDGVPLDDLNGEIASHLAAVAEPLENAEVLAPGASKSVDVALQYLGGGAGALAQHRALIVEAVLAPEDDEGNRLHVLAQMLPPGRQLLPIVVRR